MSGLEIAGLVLGAFPIAFATAKELGLTLEKAKDWWQFQRTFETFVSALSAQEIAYIQVLKRLLEPLDKVSDDEYNLLLKVPDLWAAPHIQDSLQQRLSDTELHWVMKRMDDLKDTITSIQELLPNPRTLLVLAKADARSVDRELYRFQMSFSGEKDRLLGEMTVANDELHQFLERATAVNRQAASKPKVPFRDLQNQALDFYRCLAKTWTCCCTSTHSLGISAQVAQRSGTPRQSMNGNLHVVFEYSGAKRKQVKVVVKPLVKLLPPAPAQQTTAKGFDPDAAGKIARQMEKAKRSKDSTRTPAPTTTLPVTNANISPLPPKATPSFVQRVASRLRISSRKSHSQRLVAVLANKSQPTGAASTVTLPPKLPHDANTQVKLPVRAESENNVSPRIVKFQTEISSASTLCEVQEEKLTSICDFVTQSNPPGASSTRTSVLELDDLKILLEESTEKITPAGDGAQTIDEYLASKPFRLNRLAVGLRFALTLLSLATTPWIPDSLDKQSLFLVSSPATGNGTPIGPYISTDSQNIKSSNMNAPEWHARPSLLLLGTILLELFFGERLEQQSSWEESLDEGKPNATTRFCSAFLWACRADDSMKQCFGTDLGGSLSQAIRKCIQFDFEREGDFGDAKFAEVVYREVVVPLEKCCPV